MTPAGAVALTVGIFYVFMVVVPLLVGYPRDVLRFLALGATLAALCASILVYAIVASAPHR